MEQLGRRVGEEARACETAGSQAKAAEAQLQVGLLLRSANVMISLRGGSGTSCCVRELGLVGMRPGAASQRSTLSACSRC